MNQSKLRQHSDEHAFTPNHIFSATLSSYSTLSYGTLSHSQLRLILVVGRSLTSTVSATTSLSTRCDSEIVCGTCVCMLLVMSDMMTPEMHLRLFVCFDGSNDMTWMFDTCGGKVFDQHGVSHNVIEHKVRLWDCLLDASKAAIQQIEFAYRQLALAKLIFGRTIWRWWNGAKMS